MNAKQILGLVVAAVGVFLIGYGSYAKSHISTAKNQIHEMAQSKNPIVKSIGKDMQVQVSKYGIKTKWCFFGGLVLVILGTGSAYLYRKKRRR